MTDPRLLSDFTAATGRIICIICCEDFERKDMEPVSDTPNAVWNVCRKCAKSEKRYGAQY